MNADLRLSAFIRGLSGFYRKPRPAARSLARLKALTKQGFDAISVLGNSPKDPRVRRSLIFSNSMEVHGGLQSRPESRLPESWNRDHRANRTEANRHSAPTFLYASSCC